MPKLVPNSLKQGGNRALTRNIHRHLKRLDMWVRLVHGVGYCLEFLGVGGDKDKGFDAGLGKRWHDTFGADTTGCAGNHDDLAMEGVLGVGRVDRLIQLLVSMFSELHAVLRSVNSILATTTIVKAHTS